MFASVAGLLTDRPMLLRSALYAGLALGTMTAGLASRRFGEHIPKFLAEYSGDALWSMMVFWGFCMLLPFTTVKTRGLAAIAFAFTIECTQLYHAPWIDAVRSTQIGGLILGFGFLWSDLICYCVGIAIGMLLTAAAESRWTQESRNPSSRSALRTTTNVDPS